MSALLIIFTFSLGIIVSYVLFQYNSGKNSTSVHPSLLRLKELEQSSIDKGTKKKKPRVLEFDLHGNLLPLNHNEEEYPILSNEIRKERTREITNEMIQQVKQVTAENATTEQIMFDLELSGDAQVTINTFFEQGFLENPPMNYYISPDQEPESESEEEEEEEIVEESNPTHNSSSSSNEQSSLHQGIDSMYLTPQNLMEVYNVRMDADYDLGKDSSMKTKAKNMILKARRNMEKLDKSNSLRK